MKDPGDFAEKMEICIAIEALTSEIYSDFSVMFPDARDFWADLAVSEENHARILLAASGYHFSQNLKELIIPHSLSLVDETYQYVRDIKKRIENEEISLKEAFDISLQIENLAGEKHLQEIMSKGTDSAIVATLQLLHTDDKLHHEKITDFMKIKGFLDSRT